MFLATLRLSEMCLFLENNNNPYRFIRALAPSVKSLKARFHENIQPHVLDPPGGAVPGRLWSAELCDAGA